MGTPGAQVGIHRSSSLRWRREIRDLKKAVKLHLLSAHTLPSLSYLCDLGHCGSSHDAEDYMPIVYVCVRGFWRLLKAQFGEC